MSVKSKERGNKSGKRQHTRKRCLFVKEKNKKKRKKKRKSVDDRKGEVIRYILSLRGAQR